MVGENPAHMRRRPREARHKPNCGVFGHSEVCDCGKSHREAALDARSVQEELDKLPGLLDKLPGLKEDDLNKLGPCALCKKPLLEIGDIAFYRIKLDQAFWDLNAVRQQVGLGVMLAGGRGGQVLARVMGTNADLAKITSTNEVVVHSACALDKLVHLFMSLEE